MLFFFLLAFSAQAQTPYYYLNRSFSSVQFDLQGIPTEYQLNEESDKLTDIVQGAIQLHSNETYAIEKQAAIPICYGSALSAWNAAVAYNGTPSNYPGKIFDNVGWVRGTKAVNGEWGAYLWVLQNRIEFQASTSAWWSTTNGIPVAISNVMVGSLGDYQAMSNVVDIGPKIPTNFPWANHVGTYQVDITNVFYELLIPDIWITPRDAVAAVDGSNVQFTVTGTNIPQGVKWTLYQTNFEGHAVLQTNSDWHYAGVTPGNVGTNYIVRATSKDNTNFYDQVSLTVTKVDIAQTNQEGYVYCTNCVSFWLTADSYTNVTWSISPEMGPNGAQFTSGQTWTGNGTNRWHGTSVWVYAGPVSNSYTLTAHAVGQTNCFDTATFEVFKPQFIDFNWLEATNETLHHTSAYQTNALVLRRSDKFKVEAKLSKGYTNTCFNVWFQAVQNFDGSPMTNNIPEVATDLGATDWYCKLLSVSNNADQTKTVQMEINIPSTNCPIGEYQWRARVSPKAATNIFLDTVNFPGQVIILFNPWSANDLVYMANDDERTEYVMQTMGRMWYGELTNKFTMSWYYGQFDTVSLTVLLSELSGQDAGKCANPIFVSRHLSARVNCNDGGILWGLWPDDPGATNAWPDGTNPDYWAGSDTILTQYQSTGDPVKYGQCWVFAGLLTTMLRCSGIPARPITTYDSAHDTNGNQVIEYRSNTNGIWDKDRSEKIWSFHVWCDAWMDRPDQSAQDGWQAVDATPQAHFGDGGVMQCGPASHVAVKGNLGSDYDADFVYAEVDADVEEWQDVPGGGEVLTDIWTDAVGHDISTKSVGANTTNDITSSYK